MNRYPSAIAACIPCSPLYWFFSRLYGSLLVPLLLLASLVAQAQGIPVKGLVSNAAGKPLEGVSVHVKGSKTSTLTLENGTYTLTVASSNAVLVFSFVGYEDREAPLSGNPVQHIVLKEKISTLNDVIVIGYGQQSRATVSTAVAKIEGRNIGNQPVSTPSEALAGLAAGVQVQSGQGAKPGEPAVVRVRGVTSLSSSNDPLYVVDGYPLQSSGTFNIINPNDIESIEVLKDAAAAAIYGSRAAGGVVLVTTKKGKAGKTAFSVSAYTGWQRVDQLLPVLNRDEYLAYAKTVSRIRNTPYPAVFNTTRPDTLPDVNWQKQVFRTTPVRNIEINASGGSDKVRYLASGGVFKQEGIVIGTEYTRFNARFNLDADLSKNLRLGLSIAPSYSQNYKQGTSGQFNGVLPVDQLQGVPGLLGNRNVSSPLHTAIILSPVIPVYRPNGDFAEGYDSGKYNLSPAASFFASNVVNPLNTITQAVNRQRAFRNLGNLFLEWSALPGLKLKTFIGATLENVQNHYYIPPTMAAEQAPRASFSNPLLSAIWASENSQNSIDWVWENTANYSTTIAGKHNLSLLGLFSMQHYSSQINYTAGLPGTFVTAAVQSPLASTNTIGSIGFDENSFISFAGRITYDYNKKYLFTAAVRQDGSSRFGPNNRYAVFPSFSAGWRLTEEPFLAGFFKKVSINEFKLRGGYGKTGNANIGSFTYVNAININTNYSFGGARTSGAQQSGFPNASLTWEKNEQTSMGADIGLLGNKLNLTIDYFLRYSNGMLLNKRLPSLVGYATSYQANLGRLRNNGFEFAANTTVNLGKVRWIINANLSTYKTRVINLGGPAGLTPTSAVFGWNNVFQVKVGNPLGLMYGYTTQGVFKNADDLSKHPQVASGNKVGDWIVKDQNGDGKITAADQTVIGHGLPDFTYGLTNSFQYKNFDLNILVQGVQGVNVINGNLRHPIGNAAFNTYTFYNNNFFDPAQPDRDVVWPSPNSSSSIGTGNALTQNVVENGSYLRLRNVTLGYRLPEKALQKLAMKNLRLYVTGQNLLLLTKYRGYNPETSLNGGDPTQPGVDQGTYPLARTFTVGLNIGF